MRVYFTPTLPIRNLGHLVAKLSTSVLVRVQARALCQLCVLGSEPRRKLRIFPKSSAWRFHLSRRVSPHGGAMCTRCGTLASKLSSSGQQVSVDGSGQVQRRCPASGRGCSGQDSREAALRMQSRRARVVPSHKKWRRGREQSWSLEGKGRRVDGLGCAAVRHPGDHEGQ